MSTYCSLSAQNCFEQCCNITGFCPTSSSNCYYYYSTNTVTNTYSTNVFPTGAVIGIAVGFFVFFAGIGLGIYFFFRRRAAVAALQASAMAGTSVNSTVVLPNSGYAQPVYPYPNGTAPPAYNQGYPQPMYPNQGYDGPQPYPNQYAQPQVVYNPNPIGQTI